MCVCVCVCVCVCGLNGFIERLAIGSGDMKSGRSIGDLSSGRRGQNLLEKIEIVRPSDWRPVYIVYSKDPEIPNAAYGQYTRVIFAFILGLFLCRQMFTNRFCTMHAPIDNVKAEEQGDNGIILKVSPISSAACAVTKGTE